MLSQLVGLAGALLLVGSNWPLRTNSVQDRVRASLMPARVWVAAQFAEISAITGAVQPGKLQDVGHQDSGF